MRCFISKGNCYILQQYQEEQDEHKSITPLKPLFYLDVRQRLDNLAKLTFSPI